MRSVLLVLAGALLVMPLAAAQAPLLPAAVVVQLSVLPDALVPLAAPRALPFTVELTCDATLAISPAEVLLSVTQQPAWAKVTLPVDRLTFDTCEGAPHGFARVEAEALVSVTEAAPAYVHETIEITAEARQAMRQQAVGKGSAPIVASFASILDVSGERVVTTYEDGRTGQWTLKATNFGNAATRVTMTAALSDADVDLVVPKPFLLESRQAGSNDIAETVHVSARAKEPLEAPVHVTLRWTSAYALDAQLPGASGEMLLTLLPGAAVETLVAGASQETTEDPPARVPGLGTLGAALALGLAAALVARRSRSRSR